MRVERFFGRALAASASNLDRWQYILGAVVVKGGRVLSVGTNDYDKGLHAEAAALAKHRDVVGADIYVARHRRGGCGVGMARPCQACQKKLADAGIYRVFFTTDDGGFGVLKLNRLAA